MTKVHFASLTEPTCDIADAFTRWENDPLLSPFVSEDGLSGNRRNQGFHVLAKSNVARYSDGKYVSPSMMQE